MALSTTESEYMAATHASKEAVWLQRLCSGIGLVQEAVRIECDSQSAIFLAKNPAYHSKTKHIDVQYHFVRDMIEEKKVSLMKVDTLKNVVDSLTKSMSTEKFSWCKGSMMQEHRSMSAACQPTSTSNTHLMEKGRGTTLSILKFEISINVVRLLMPDHTFVQVVVEVSFNGFLQKAHNVVKTGHPFM